MRTHSIPAPACFWLDARWHAAYFPRGFARQAQRSRDGDDGIRRQNVPGRSQNASRFSEHLGLQSAAESHTQTWKLQSACLRPLKISRCIVENHQVRVFGNEVGKN